jgi:hypothetical protein
MPHYVISFNQQWVGDHTPEWFASRGPLARAVVAQMQANGVLIFAGGLEEDIDQAYSAVPTDEGVAFSQGPYSPGAEYLGGLTVIQVPDDDVARMWAGKVAQACGWPQEVRRLKT